MKIVPVSMCHVVAECQRRSWKVRRHLRKQYGRPILLDKLLGPDRVLDQAVQGRHVVFRAPLMDRRDVDDPPGTAYMGPNFAMTRCYLETGDGFVGTALIICKLNEGVAAP